MTRLLYWAPRLLAIAFILFISLFSLDALQQGLVALLLHLLPSVLMTLVLVIAWRREWVGALFFALTGAYYVGMTVPKSNLAMLVRVSWIAVIAGPAFLIAILFWTNWRSRKRAL
jgi:hypothetical protein